MVSPSQIDSLVSCPAARPTLAAPGAVWQVRRSGATIVHLQRKQPWPHVNHYHFHIIDPEWGHLTIKMSAHPPFGAQIILNGHEWVEREARHRGLSLTKEADCFSATSDPQILAEIADTLHGPAVMGRLAGAGPQTRPRGCRKEDRGGTPKGQPIDRHYYRLRSELQATLQTLGMAV